MNKRILIIDDDDDILEILHIVFRDEVFNVVVSNSADAVSQIHLINPDLVLLDVRINGSPKRGDEICAELKAQSAFQKLPVVLVSAETDLAILANECGADFYVQKPFDIYDLLIRVKTCLEL